jgi:hypothetical protein
MLFAYFRNQLRTKGRTQKAYAVCNYSHICSLLAWSPCYLLKRKKHCSNNMNNMQKWNVLWHARLDYNRLWTLPVNYVTYVYIFEMPEYHTYVVAMSCVNWNYYLQKLQSFSSKMLTLNYRFAVGCFWLTHIN